MNTIIIYGSRKDTQIKDILFNMLSNNFNINCISQKITSSTGKQNEINIIETSDLEEILIKNSILIIKKNANVHSLKSVDQSTNIIINSSDVKSVIKFSKSLSKIYSCGFSSKDYITFSSRVEDKAIVSLQRSIVLLNDEICEPLEIPCYFNENIKDYSILSSMMCLILLNLIGDTK